MRFFITVNTVVLLTAGCTMSVRKSPILPPSPPSATTAWKTTTEKSFNPPAELSLQEVLKAVRVHHPRLKAALLEIRARRGFLHQSSLLPNPELEVETERSAEQTDGETLESSVEVIQEIEIGGKRKARMKVAEAELRLAEWAYREEEFSLLAEALIRFVDVLAAQERLALRRKTATLAEEMYRMVEERVKAGKVSPIEGVKASVEMAKHRLAVETAKTELETARRMLAMLWGSPSPTFTSVKGDLAKLPPLPSLPRLRTLLAETPRLARWKEEVDKQRWLTKLVRAERIPDITVGCGYSSAGAEGKRFVLLAGIPLPIFDRKQGETEAARNRLKAATYEQALAHLSLTAAIEELFLKLQTTRTTIEALSKHVLPAAEKVFSTARKGYEEGKTDYLKVLDAQRTLFEAQTELLEARIRFHRSLATLKGLVGFNAYNKAIEKGKENER